jgi:hypothetical protein
LSKNTTNSALVGEGRSWVITLPVATSSAANRSMVPLRSSSWVALRRGGQHQQDRRRPVQCLDPRLLVDREHGRGDRRVQMPSDDVADLLHQVRVRGDLELVLPPRLEPQRPPDLLGSPGAGWPSVAASWLDGLALPCRAAQEVSVPDGSTPVGEVVIVV